MADGLGVWIPILPLARRFLEWPLAHLLSAGEQLPAPLADRGDAENPTPRDPATRNNNHTILMENI